MSRVVFRRLVVFEYEEVPDPQSDTVNLVHARSLMDELRPMTRQAARDRQSVRAG